MFHTNKIKLLSDDNPLYKVKGPLHCEIAVFCIKFSGNNLTS